MSVRASGGPHAKSATPLLRGQDPGDNDPKGEQSGDGQSVHPQLDSESIRRDDIVQGAPMKLGERDVELAPSRCRPGTNWSELA